MVCKKGLNTAVNGFSRGNALAMAHHANLSYESRECIGESLNRGGYRIESSFFFEDCHTHTQGYVIAAENHLIISFRGTENDWEDWVSNIKIGLQPWSSGQDNDLVHNGFKMALDSVWQQLISQIDQYRDNKQPVWITGHSLGAALAVLAGLRLSELRPDIAIAGIYTFAQPRVGNDGFVKRLETSIADRVYRVVNKGDMVPELPPQRMGYRHGGHLEKITDSGDIIEDYHPCWFVTFWERLKGYAPLIRLVESAMNNMEEHRLDSYIDVLGSR